MFIRDRVKLPELRIGKKKAENPGREGGEKQLN